MTAFTNTSAFRSTSRLGLGLVAVGWAMALACGPAFAADDDPWAALKVELFGTKAITEDAAGLELDAPYRADDAAIVPITVKLPASLGDVKSLTLVVDKNPAPMAASFTFGPAAGTGDRSIATRLRFDNYSNLRAIVEKADGTLLMVTKFVKAAGGCSAPALKDADEALANLGKSQVKLLTAPEGKNGYAAGTRDGAASELFRDANEPGNGLIYSGEICEQDGSFARRRIGIQARCWYFHQRGSQHPVHIRQWAE